MKKKVIAKNTIARYIAHGRNICEKCGDAHITSLTIDHIVPMSILLLAGIPLEETYDDRFITILCRKCNQYKSNRIDFIDIRTKNILEYIISYVWKNHD